MTRFRYSSRFPVSPEALFDFHRDVRNLARISPPGQDFELLGEPKPAEPGDIQRFVVGMGPFRVHWEAGITRVDAPFLLEDVQRAGPFRRFRHQHQVYRDRNGSRLTDVIAFRFFPTMAGEFLEWLTIRPVLLGLFWYRHRRTRMLLSEGK